MASRDPNPSARRLLIALALGLLLAGYGLALYVATAARAPSPVESALARDGFGVSRGASGPLDALHLASPDALVLVDPPPLLSAERNALESFVERGGTLWVVSLHPEDALWPALASQVHVLPGAVYAADGGTARYHVPGAIDAFPRGRMQAVLVEGEGATPLLESEASAVRDTNGDGVLQAGEPTGPFRVAVRVAAGQGQVLVVVAQPLASGEDALPYGRLAPDAPRSVVLVDAQHPGAWSKPPRAVLAMLAAVPALWWLDALLALVVAAALLLLTTTSQASAPASQKPADLIRSLGSSLPPSHPFRSILEEEE